MNSRGPLVLGLLVVLGLLAYGSLYVVKETERAVELRFGRLTNVDIPPGLHVKFPFADQIRKFDARVMTMDAPSESFYTIEKKRLIVDAYAKWRVADVAAYYKATGGNEAIAQNRLANRVNDGLRNQFGTRTLNEVVSGERDLLMSNLTEALNQRVFDELGIQVVDVRVKRIDLPSEVSEQVFRRMTAEREKEARELRSRGIEQAERIRASADRERTVIKANAYKEAQTLRGEGDATAASIYAQSFSRDPEFYSFTRSLTAYRESFSDRGDIILVDPDGDFFKYLKKSGGR